MYFAAIVEKNTVNGKCQLKPGIYSAREIADCVKAACGSYELPEDLIFDESVEIAADNFKCRFPYRRIFIILAQWEAMSRAGKLKAVFEIGEVEEKSAKILVDEKTALGAYATKGMKVQRVTGNWWMPRKLPKNGDVALFYELNGVMFVPGLTFFVDRIKKERKSVVERCAGIGDEEIKKLFLSFLAKNPDSSAFGYFAEVARLVNLDTQSEEAAAIMEAAREEKRKREEENARREAEEAERRRIAKEETREQAEKEEREAAESLAKAKEKFIAGKMISRNDFERIAESIGYEINIRTLGTLRKRVGWIEVDGEGTPTVYGTKKRAGLDGTFEVIREVYALVKVQSEEAAKQATETPQIHETSNYITEPEKHSTEPRDKPKQAIRIFRTTQPRTIKRFLIVQIVPRQCFTIRIAPPGYAPPIRGDCMSEVDCQWLSDNR